jgi:hypothetical protein
MDKRGNIIHTKLFNEICNQDIQLYVEFIDMVNYEYDQSIQIMETSDDVLHIRMNVHKLIGILSYLYSEPTEEIIYLCKILLQNDKNNKNLTKFEYLHFIDNIIRFDKDKLGLRSNTRKTSILCEIL